MGEIAQTDSDLFAGGPPVRLQRSLGLIKPENPRVIYRAVLAGVIATLLPFMPVALLIVPIDVLLQKLVQFLL